MKKDEARKKVAGLVEKYRQYEREGKLAEMSEQDTKAIFIEPLFDALGWKMRDFEEVSREEKVSRGRADYAFRISGVIRLFVEAKAASVPIEEKEAEQAINYAYLQSVSWAILTNFDRLVIYNSEYKAARSEDSRFLSFTADELLPRFDELWRLRQESVASGEFDSYAERVGRKPKRDPVTKTLFNDFMRWRGNLAKGIDKYDRGKKLSKEDKDEAIQKFLNRLIFIRTCEDRGLENERLRATVREWEKDRKKRLTSYVRDIFEEYNIDYDSGIFAPHMANGLTLDDEVLASILLELYESPTGVHYKFDDINAEVLGNIYEQYLATILRAGGGLLERDEKRKEMGIYYTPSYIVKYIVQNTLGELVSKAKTASDLEKIRVLDPACGSGSFLIEAYKALDKAYREKNGGDHQRLGENISHNAHNILTRNLHGVDLDNKAVEIAELNLLLCAAWAKGLLPSLSDNIKRGNSLISGSEEELRKYFGEHWRLKHPFNWEEQFADAMKGGGFDVVIGNPPWVSIKGKHKSIDMPEQELRYFFDKYKCDTYMPNLYELFIWRGLSLLRKGGMFSLIVPDRFCTNQQFIKLRRYILENFSIKKLWFKVSFPDVVADTVIFVLQKEKHAEAMIEVAEYPNEVFIKIPQKVFYESSDFSFFYASKEIFDTFERIKANKNTKSLGELVSTTSGCGAKSSELSEEKKNNRQIQILKGESIQPYEVRKHFWFEFKVQNLSGRTRDEKKLGKKFKVLLRKTGSDLIAAFDDSGIYPEQSLYFVYTEKDDERDLLLVITAILNSKLMNCYYRNFAITNRDSMPQLKNIDLDRFPIILPSNSQPFLKAVGNALHLKRELKRLGDRQTTERAELEAEIARTDAEIDGLVYKLYGITEEEKKIIEESFGAGK